MYKNISISGTEQSFAEFYFKTDFGSDFSCDSYRLHIDDALNNSGMIFDKKSSLTKRKRQELR